MKNQPPDIDENMDTSPGFSDWLLLIGVIIFGFSFWFFLFKNFIIPLFK